MGVSKSSALARMVLRVRLLTRKLKVRPSDHAVACILSRELT